jgi:ABC-2 type transport system permease protein
MSGTLRVDHGGREPMIGSMAAVIEHDLRVFCKYRFTLAGLISVNLADLLVMAVVFTRMTGFDYFRFLSPGIVAMGLFAAAFVIGREVNGETRRAYNLYLLSLPLRRSELVLGRMIAGGLRGMLYGTPLLVLAMFILKFPTAAEFALILFAMFLLSMGISGLAISLAVAFRSFERFTTARSLLYLMLVFCSTVFYPIAVLQQILPRSLMVLAQWNPLSRVSDIVRGYLIGAPVITLQSWAELLLFSAVFILSGAGMYAAAIERSTK